MAAWYECKVRYDKMHENGAVRKVSERFLVDALSFTEAEARIIEERTPYISGDFAVKAIKSTNITEIFWDEKGDYWYLGKLLFTEIDEKGNEKKKNTLVLIQANDFKSALDNLLEGMKGTVIDYEISSINKTPILEVYKANQGKRTGDNK